MLVDQTFWCGGKTVVVCDAPLQSPHSFAINKPSWAVVSHKDFSFSFMSILQHWQESDDSWFLLHISVMDLLKVLGSEVQRAQ